MPGDHIKEGEQVYIAQKIGEINIRAKTASPKVAERAARCIEKVGMLGGNHYAFHKAIEEPLNDLYILRDDPNNPVGAGQYDGWTPAEIEELYEVLNGNKMAD